MARVKKPLCRTPRSVIQSALRQLWMRSAERYYAMDRDNCTCQECGRKRSAAKGREVKVVVHHIEEDINWDKIIAVLQEGLLPDPALLTTLCVECHLKAHGKEVRK